MNPGALVWKAFRRNPWACLIALAMPFGAAVILLLAAAELPEVKMRKCNLCGEQRRADGKPCQHCGHRDGECGREERGETPCEKS